MTGVSFTWLLITTFALFSLIVCAPSGAKSALSEVISKELYWSGAYLSLTSALFSILMWIWQIPLEEIFGSVFENFFNVVLPAFVSTIFGAFLWILLSLGFQKRLSIIWVLLSLGYCLLMVGLNYLPVVQAAVLKFSHIAGSRDEALDLVASLLLTIALVTLSYLYIKNRKCLTSGSSRSLRSLGTG
jgi:hypothetical protein